jgi:8-oxo-dGTP diphosphatase
MKPHEHCHFCGTAYGNVTGFPRTCPECKQTIWSNPLPVAVVLVKMDDGVLIIRRGIEPAKGHWALPGGFIETGESWQEGACRELREETGLILPQGEIELIDALSVVQNRQIILFCKTRNRHARRDFTFIPCEETLDLRVMTTPEELAFSAHTEYARRLLMGEIQQR